MKRTQQGFAPIYVIIAAVAAVALLVGGFVAFRLHSKKTASGPSGQPTVAPDEMTALAAPDVDFDLSISPISDLAVPTLDVGPTIAGNAVSGMNVDTDVGYSGSVSVTKPTVKIAAPTMPTISAPPSAPPASQPSSGGLDTAPAGGQEQGGVSAANCEAFSSMPSAQYCSQIGDPSGRTLCEDCKAAGY